MCGVCTQRSYKGVMHAFTAESHVDYSVPRDSVRNRSLGLDRAVFPIIINPQVLRLLNKNLNTYTYLEVKNIYMHTYAHVNTHTHLPVV